MKRWIEVDREIINDPRLQRLSPWIFKREFLAAVRGEESLFSEWIRLGPEHTNNSRPRASLWARLRAAVFIRDGRACKICGSVDRPSVDHIEPIARGGPSNLGNLQVLCVPCNSRKGARP